MDRKKSGFGGILCIFWVILILIFASQGGNGSHGISLAVTRTIGKIMFPDFSSWSADVQSDWVSSMEQLVRKTAHFIEFTVLGMLTFLTVRGILTAVKRKKTVAAFQCGMTAFLICCVIAVVSELVQINALNRTASAADVLLDCCGVLLGIFLIGFGAGRRTLHSQNRSSVSVRHRKG